MNHLPAPLRRLLIVGTVAVLVAGCGSTTPTTAPAVVAPTGTPTVAASPSLSESPSPSPSLEASPSPSPTAAPVDLTKAPFTVLVLGGDNGFRTDAMVVVGIDPVKRTISYASLPRDTIDVPLPVGGVFKSQKVNAFYNYAGARPSQYPQGAGRATADMMGKLLGIHIDYYAGTTFDGFVALVNAMGGVRVNVPQTVVDPYYEITMTNVGIRFNTGWQVMKGDRALIYGRTRMGDSDFQRAKRQQIFLNAAGNQLLSKPSLLTALVAAKRNLVTDFPLAQVPALINVIGSVPAASVNRGTVFSPPTYSTKTACTCGYALEPNLAAIRKQAAKLFPWAVTP
jgi:polyisoprenyl-teichoic acid--peptidoglycan teichoic acid transferase